VLLDRLSVKPTTGLITKCFSKVALGDSLAHQFTMHRTRLLTTKKFASIKFRILYALR